jgi:hypothetical protein
MGTGINSGSFEGMWRGDAGGWRGGGFPLTPALTRSLPLTRPWTGLCLRQIPGAASQAVPVSLGERGNDRRANLRGSSGAGNPLRFRRGIVMGTGINSGGFEGVWRGDAGGWRGGFPLTPALTRSLPLTRPWTGLCLRQIPGAASQAVPVSLGERGNGRTAWVRLTMPLVQWFQGAGEGFRSGYEVFREGAENGARGGRAPGDLTHV